MRTEDGHNGSGAAGGRHPARHRPAVGLALALIAGILAAWRLDPSAAWLVGAGALTVATAAILAVRRPASHLTVLAVLAVVAVLGGVRYWLAATPLDPAHIGRFATDRRALVRLAGRVVTQPHVRDPARSKEAFQPVLGPSTRFYLEAKWLTHADVRRRASGRVLVMVYDPVAGVDAGDRVEIVGRLTRPSGPANPGQHARPGSRLAAILTTDHAEAVTRLASEWSASGAGVLAALRRHMASTLDRHLDARAAGALKALLIGDRRRIETDLKRAFVVTGTAHLLAISGLHVGLVAAMAWWLLRLVRVPERAALIAVVGVAFLYALVTGLHAPALRACVMIALLALGGLVQRDPDHINSLALAAIVVLLVDPTDLFRAGFHLSFVATLGLLLFADPLRHILQSVGQRLSDAREGQRLASVARPGRRRLLRRRLGHALRRAFVVCLVAWLVTVPLSAHYFRHVAWVCPLATLVAAPCLWLTLTSALLMCVAGAFGLADALAPAARASFHLLEGTVTLFANVPGSGALHGWSPPLGAVALCYVGFGVVALRNRLGLSTRRIALALVLVAAGAVWRTCSDPAPSVPEVTVLDVGHGQCSVLRTPEGHTILFDAGSLTRTGGAWRTVERALIAWRVNRIDLVVLSHPDIDHYSALPGLLTAFPVGGVVVPRRFLTSADPEVARLLEHIRADDVPLRVVEVGDVIDGFEPLRLTVLHPGSDSGLVSDNDVSLVVLATYGDLRVLSTGDLQEAGIAALLACGAPLQAEVLLAPHHGRYEPNLDALLVAVEPGVVLISGPLTERVQRALPVYEKQGRRVFVTGRCGAITVRLASEPHPRTWRRPLD